MVNSGIRSSTVAWLSASALVAGVLFAASAPAAQALTRIKPSVAAPSVYVVPAGVASIRVTLIAAGGLEPFCGSTAGRGGSVAATIPVTPGETLRYNLGNYFVQSASGNSSDIRRSPYTLDDRLVVAGGGGSAADFAGLDGLGGCTGMRAGPGLGGDGGSPAGLAGTGEDPGQCTFPAGHPGGGGQVNGPGAAGTTCGAGGAGGPGVFGHGGVGGDSGTAVAPCSHGGAGGDGWWGGGGGGGTLGAQGSPGGCTDVNGKPVGKTIGGGGGGGSSFAVLAATDVVFAVGVNATSAGSVSIDSSTATPLATTLTIKASPTAVTYGSATTLSGVLKTLAGAALSARSVTIRGRQTGAAAYSTVGTATTNASGAYVLSVKPTRGTTYVASFAGGVGVAAHSSAGVLVSVRPRVTFVLNDATAKRGQTVVFSGVVSPKSTLQVVFLQRLVSGTWTNVKSMKVTTASSFRFAWRPTSGVDYYFRVLVPARTGYVAGATVKKLLTVA